MHQRYSPNIGRNKYPIVSEVPCRVVKVLRANTKLARMMGDHQHLGTKNKQSNQKFYKN